jgi:hypothetical protein
MVRPACLRAASAIALLVAGALGCSRVAVDYVVHAVVQGTVFDTAKVAVDSAVVVGSALRDCIEGDGPTFIEQTASDGHFSMALHFFTEHPFDRGCVAITVQPPRSSGLMPLGTMVRDVDFRSGVPSTVKLHLAYGGSP